jgi:hypothetical protein
MGVMGVMGAGARGLRLDTGAALRRGVATTAGAAGTAAGVFSTVRVTKWAHVGGAGASGPAEKRWKAVGSPPSNTACANSTHAVNASRRRLVDRRWGETV